MIDIFGEGASPVNILPKDGEVLFIDNFFKRSYSDKMFDALSKSIQWGQESINIYGNQHNIPRLTAWYGDSGNPYKYSGISMNPIPWIDDLIDIKEKIKKIDSTEFNSVLLNLYRDGKDSVSWHSDDEDELGVNPVIASVSFGSSRIFKLRHLEDKTTKDIELSHGSLLIMRGETQHKWEHQIPKTSKKIGPRINLTFRVIK